jgi:adenylate/nucleoside-diphosphate kinase
LTSEILDKIVKRWWNEEPFRSRGFILEGFPSTDDETVYMIENQLAPDIVIQLDTEENEILKRVLPTRIEQWSKKMQQRRDKRTNIKGKKDRDKVQ